MAQLKNISNSVSAISNPLFIIVMLLIGLIVILAIFRSASPFLNIGFGVNAHIGELKGTFEIEAFDNQEPLFVMYFAEWCGHCKTTKPEFLKLGEKYKNIKVMLVDAEADENKELVKSQNISGYPTIRYYKSGNLEDKGDEYSGGRTEDDFKSFLDSQ
jgi:thiol-disulfide isomerase/thioredoxin